MAAAHSAGAEATSSGPANATRMPTPSSETRVGPRERRLAETTDARDR